MSRSLAKGILAGVVGGLAGSVALRIWMTALSRVHEDTFLPDQNGPAHKVASILADKVTGKPLTDHGRLIAGEVVHYVFGAFTGGIYGGLAEYQPWTTAGGGLLFGTGVFLAADESSMPILGLVPPPWTESLAAQLEHWAAHAIFGLVSDYTRRNLRRKL